MQVNFIVCTAKFIVLQAVSVQVLHNNGQLLVL